MVGWGAGGECPIYGSLPRASLPSLPLFSVSYYVPGSARSGPHRRLNYLPSRFSIIILLFFVVPFVSHLALPSLGWGRVHLLTGTRREGCAHTHTRMHRPDILISRPTPARYTVHDSEYIGLALNYRPLAPTCDTRQPCFSLLPLHLHLSPSTVRPNSLSPTKL